MKALKTIAFGILVLLLSACYAPTPTYDSYNPTLPLVDSDDFELDIDMGRKHRYNSHKTYRKPVTKSYAKTSQSTRSYSRPVSSSSRSRR